MRFGNANPRVVKRKNRITLTDDTDKEFAAAIRRFTQQSDDEANEFVRPFAVRFAVSMVAMRIRLERLGLLLRDVPHQPILACGA